MTVAVVVLALVLGFTLGYLAAVRRTPALLARMTKPELADLAQQVAQRRGRR